MIRRAPRPTSNFYLLDKAISEDLRLGWAARGMLIFLLGKPDNWTVSAAALVNETAKAFRSTGRDGVYAALKELKDAGYLRTIGQRSDGGTFSGADYLVTESPHTDFPDMVDQPDTEIPDAVLPGQPLTASPYPVNPIQIRTEEKQGLKREQGLKRASAPTPRSFLKKPEDVTSQTWADWLQLRKGKRAAVTQTVVEEARREADKAGLSLERFLVIWCVRGWQGLEAGWLKPSERGTAAATTPAVDPDAQSAVEAEGIAKGIGPWNQLREQWPVYKARVRGSPACKPVDLNALAGLAVQRSPLIENEVTAAMRKRRQCCPID